MTKHKDRAVVLGTHYGSNPDDVRLKLYMRTAQAIVDQGIGLIVVDSSPDGETANLVGSIKGGGFRIYSSNEGMAAKRRYGFQMAFDAGYSIVGHMEPEKLPLVPELPRLFEHVVQAGGIVIPARSSFAGYPDQQRILEEYSNLRANRLAGTKGLDYWFAPKFFNEQSAQYFLRYEDRFAPYGMWDGVMMPVAHALADRHQVTCVEVDFTYPAEQAEAEKKDPTMEEKRWTQSETLLSGWEAACRYYGLSR